MKGIFLRRFFNENLNIIAYLQVMEGKINYAFTSELWKSAATGSWHFVTLPKDISKEIREHLGWQEETWGRLKIQAQIDTLIWDTAIWFDTKMDAYLLPIKADIRRKANLEIEQSIHVQVWI